MSVNKTGLVVGSFFAVIHAVWLLVITIIPTSFQKFLDWVFELHALKPVYVLTSVSIANAIFLVVITFIFGYLFGVLFAGLHNWLSKYK